MMKKIRFMLEYHCSPIWVLDGDSLIGVGLPKDMLDNEDLSELLESISSEYDDLFINNSVEFSYKGFSCIDDEKKFDEKIGRAVALLKKAAVNKYIIEIDDSTYQ